MNSITLKTSENYTGIKKTIDKVYIISNQHFHVSLNFIYILVARKKKSQFLGKASFTNDLKYLQKSNGLMVNPLKQGKAFNGGKQQKTTPINLHPHCHHW